jgi:hypothetical protein
MPSDTHNDCAEEYLDIPYGYYPEAVTCEVPPDDVYSLEVQQTTTYIDSSVRPIIDGLAEVWLYGGAGLEELSALTYLISQ